MCCCDRTAVICAQYRGCNAAGIKIKGMAHITGGGFEGNISRILPEGMQAVIETNMWNVPPIFALIERTW